MRFRLACSFALLLALPVVAVAPAKPFGRGILPDVRVEPTIGDLLAGRDVELEKALALARR